MWATLGFDVMESYTSGNTYTCNGKKGETVCVTATVGYTDYTGHEVIAGGNCISAKTDPYVIYSPNKSGQQLYRCHHGSNCHDLDWESWNHDGRDCSTYLP